MPARRRAPECTRDVLDHLARRHRLLPRQDEGLADRRRMRRGEQEPVHQVAHVDGLALILPRADDEEAAAVERAEQFEQTKIARPVGLGDAHDARRQLGAVGLHHLFGGELAPAVDVQRPRRRVLIERHAGVFAVHADGAAVDEAFDARTPARLDQAFACR